MALPMFLVEMVLLLVARLVLPSNRTAVARRERSRVTGVPKWVPATSTISG
jgi:hypothetical protein